MTWAKPWDYDISQMLNWLSHTSAPNWTGLLSCLPHSDWVRWILVTMSGIFSAAYWVFLILSFPITWENYTSLFPFGWVGHVTRSGQWVIRRNVIFYFQVRTFHSFYKNEFWLYALFYDLLTKQSHASFCTIYIFFCNIIIYGCLIVHSRDVM